MKRFVFFAIVSVWAMFLSIANAQIYPEGTHAVLLFGTSHPDNKDFACDPLFVPTYLAFTVTEDDPFGDNYDTYRNKYLMSGEDLQMFRYPKQHHIVISDVYPNYTDDCLLLTDDMPVYSTMSPDNYDFTFRDATYISEDCGGKYLYLCYYKFLTWPAECIIYYAKARKENGVMVYEIKYDEPQGPVIYKTKNWDSMRFLRK